MADDKYILIWTIEYWHIDGYIIGTFLQVSIADKLTNMMNLQQRVLIIILESAVQGRERVRTLYQSKDPNPTQPTHGRKKKKKQ